MVRSVLFFFLLLSGVTSGMSLPMLGKPSGFMSLGTFGSSGLSLDGVTDVISFCFSFSRDRLGPLLIADLAFSSSLFSFVCVCVCLGESLIMLVCYNSRFVLFKLGQAIVRR